MISRTLYEGFTTQDGEFDTGKFVESFLLYETIVVANPTIIPRISESIGVEDLCSLIQEGRIVVECGGTTAQATCDYKSPGFFSDRPLNRPLRFAFETIYFDPNAPGNLNTEDRLARAYNDSKGNKLNKSDLERLHSTTLKTMRIINGSQLNVGDTFRHDLTSKPSLIANILLDSLARDHAIPVYALNTKLTLEEISKDIFQINTNLGLLLSRSDDDIHELLKKRFFEITATLLQLQRMQAVNAIAGLNPIQASITAKRIDFLSRIYAESDTRGELTRIIEIADVPTLPVGSKIDINTLAKLRDSDEAAAFRDWIHKYSNMSDQEVKNIVSNWKKKLGEIIRTDNAKSLRWLSSTGLGSLEPISGTIFSGVDFFLDKFLPGMGPLGFITGNYKTYIKSQLSNQ